MKSILCPVDLGTLNDLNTLNKEALFSLLRFYNGVETNIPDKFKPILFGKRSFYYFHINENIIAQIIESALSGVLAKKKRCMFMVEHDGHVFITENTKNAIAEYLSIEGYIPEIYITYKEWKVSPAYKNRFGEWGGFW